MLNKFSASLRSWGGSLFAGEFFASWRFFALFAVLLFGTIFVGRQVMAADIAKYVAVVMGYIFHYILTFEGLVLLALVNYVLVPIAQYNNFINSSAVETGWFIVRDVVNMFYVLILLAIAFGTILGVDSFNYSKALPKLLISAIIVNFSRTICGLFIDLSQVVMLTFVNGFSLAAGGNFAKAFKIDKMLNYQKNLDATSTEAFAVIAGLLLAVFLIGFSIVMIVYISVLLVMRIVYLWILIILSPVAFFLRALPTSTGSSHYGEWWKMFVQYNVSGPVLAFFLWLSLLVVANDGVTKGIPSAGVVDTPAVTIPTQIFQPEHLQGFIVSICLLYAGAEVSKKLGNIPMREVRGKATGAAKSAFRSARTAARGVGRVAGAAGNTALGTKVQMLGSKGLSKVPFMRQAGLKNISRLRQREAARGADSAKMYAGLSAEQRAGELRRLSNKPNMLKTNEEKGREKQLAALSLEDKLKGRGFREGATDKEKRNETLQTKRRLDQLSEGSYDTAMTAKVAQMMTKRPDLIVDDTEKDPKKMEEQRKALAKTAGRMGVGQLNDMDASGMRQEVMMHVSPTAIAKAMSSGKLSFTQEEALTKIGFSDKAENNKKVQSDLRTKNASYLPEADRKKLVTEQVAAAKTAPSGSDARAESARAALDAMGGKVSDKDTMKMLADNDMGVHLAREMTDPSKDRDGNARGKVQVDGQALAESPDLAKQLAGALKADQMEGLSDDIKQGLTEALSEQAKGGEDHEAVGKAIAAGISAEKIFDLNSSTGQDNLQSYMNSATDQKNLERLLGSISANIISANNGDNAVAKSAMSVATPEMVKGLYQSGKQDQALAMGQAARGLAETSSDPVVKSRAADINESFGIGTMRQAMKDASFVGRVSTAQQAVSSAYGRVNDKVGKVRLDFRMSGGVSHVAQNVAKGVKDAVKGVDLSSMSSQVGSAVKSGFKSGWESGVEGAASVTRKIKRKTGRV